MDLQEYTEVSAKIAELGMGLKAKRADRDQLDQEIRVLEEQLRPLVVQHSRMLADLLGTPPVLVTVPTPTPAPAAVPISRSEAEDEVGDVVMRPAKPSSRAEIKRRVMKFLEQSEPGIGAIDIAQALRLDGTLVREIMQELMLNRAGGS